MIFTDGYNHIRNSSIELMEFTEKLGYISVCIIPLASVNAIMIKDHSPPENSSVDKVFTYRGGLFVEHCWKSATLKIVSAYYTLEQYIIITSCMNGEALNSPKPHSIGIAVLATIAVPLQIYDLHTPLLVYLPE